MSLSGSLTEHSPDDSLSCSRTFPASAELLFSEGEPPLSFAIVSIFLDGNAGVVLATFASVGSSLDVGTSIRSGEALGSLLDYTLRSSNSASNLNSDRLALPSSLRTFFCDLTALCIIIAGLHSLF